MKLLEITEEDKKKVEEWATFVDSKIYNFQTHNDGNTQYSVMPFIDRMGNMIHSTEVSRCEQIPSMGLYTFSINYYKNGYVLNVANSATTEQFEITNENASNIRPTAMLFELSKEDLSDIASWQCTEEGTGNFDDYTYEVIPTGLMLIKRVINERTKCILELSCLQVKYADFSLICPECNEIFRIYFELTPFGSSVQCLFCNKKYQMSPSYIFPDEVSIIKIASYTEKIGSTIKPHDNIVKISGLPINVHKLVLPDTAANILLIDKDTTLLSLIGQEIREIFGAKCATIECQYGDTALKLLGRYNTKINLIICEILLDDMTGIEMLKWRKRRFSEIPFIIYSGMDFIESFPEPKPDAYIIKSSDLSKLMDKVASLLKIEPLN